MDDIERAKTTTSFLFGVFFGVLIAGVIAMMWLILELSSVRPTAAPKGEQTHENNEAQTVVPDA